jgi:hypothetical protein
MNILAETVYIYIVLRMEIILKNVSIVYFVL